MEYSIRPPGTRLVHQLACTVDFSDVVLVLRTIWVITCPGSIARGVGQVPDVLVWIVQMSGVLGCSCTLVCLLWIHVSSCVFAESVRCVVLARNSGSIRAMKMSYLLKCTRIPVFWCSATDIRASWLCPNHKSFLIFTLVLGSHAIRAS